MGAWGHKSFENDSVLNFFEDFQDADASRVGEALDVIADATDDDYVDADDASAALGAAELLAAAHGRGEDRLSSSARTWLAGHVEGVRAFDIARARRVVERVLRRSELQELWEENGPDTEWHEDVRALLERLK